MSIKKSLLSVLFAGISISGINAEMQGNAKVFTPTTPEDGFWREIVHDCTLTYATLEDGKKYANINIGDARVFEIVDNNGNGVFDENDIYSGKFLDHKVPFLVNLPAWERSFELENVNEGVSPVLWLPEPYTLTATRLLLPRDALEYKHPENTLKDRTILNFQTPIMLYAPFSAEDARNLNPKAIAQINEIYYTIQLIDKYL